MAQEEALRGDKLLIEIEDDDAPGVFAHPCVINTDRSISFQADVNETPTYDCDNPGAVAWKQREKQLLSADIAGSGRLYSGDISVYDAWVRSPDSKRIRVKVDATADKGGGYWLGYYHLTQFQVSAGGIGTTVEVSVALQSTGEVGAFVPVAA